MRCHSIIITCLYLTRSTQINCHLLCSYSCVNWWGSSHRSDAEMLLWWISMLTRPYNNGVNENTFLVFCSFGRLSISYRFSVLMLDCERLPLCYKNFCSQNFCYCVCLCLYLPFLVLHDLMSISVHRFKVPWGHCRGCCMYQQESSSDARPLAIDRMSDEGLAEKLTFCLSDFMM